MIRLWRIVKRQHAGTAFDGKAAQRFGGRWNSPGQPAVYASASKSLAMLEILVHLDVGRALPEFVSFTFDVDDGLVVPLNTRLPRDWRVARSLSITQQIGDEFLAAATHVALGVPSVIVPEESNYLLNPRHPEFATLTFGRPQAFTLDPRLSAKR